jgi:Predicted P-loop ATPase
MWSDNETTEDYLGFKVHADLLLKVINDESLLPITIGVFGDWGSGKSSILQMIKQKFEEKDEISGEYLDKDTLCIYFNGWTFEGYDDAKAALLNAILKEIEENTKLTSEIQKIVVDKAKKLWESIDWMRGAGMIMKNIALSAVTAYFTGGLSLIPFATQKIKEWGVDTPEKLIDKLKSEEGSEFFKSLQKEENTKPNRSNNVVSDFRRNFEDLLTTTGFKKLVVIIDDLDRCTPDRIIENLEAVKLFLNVPKTAYIIGADPRIVRHAIELKYKTDSISLSTDDKIKNDRIVSDYLEKLIQIPYNLPKLSDNEVETYLTLLLCKKSFPDNFPHILNAYQKHIEYDRHSVFGFGNIQEALPNLEISEMGRNISILASSSKIITNGLKGNPRQIKRFLNTYILRERLIATANFKHIKMDILAKIMVLEYANIDLFRELYEWQAKGEKLGEPKQIIELENWALEMQTEQIKDKYSINWSQVGILNWLNAEPKLSGVDLRDYFWVSRDQLSDSVSASSMISKTIRDLHNAIISFSADKNLTNLVKEKVVPLNEADLKTLLGLFENEVLKNPSDEKMNLIFIELMKQKVLFTADLYLKIIRKIDQKLLPGHLSSKLKIAKKENSEINKIIDELIKADTKIAKSLKN